MTTAHEMLQRLVKCNTEQHKMYQVIGESCPCPSSSSPDFKWHQKYLSEQSVHKLRQLWRTEQSGVKTGLLWWSSKLRTLEETIAFFQDIKIAANREEAEAFIAILIPQPISGDENDGAFYFCRETGIQLQVITLKKEMRLELTSHYKKAY